MRIKANGISINYEVDGASGPWLVLSNSLATDLTMWDEQARGCRARSACCATTSAGTARPSRRRAATRSSS